MIRTSGESASGHHALGAVIWPNLRAWSFSIKTFVSAMLALWIALQLDLDRPYWAMATVYIVAQPLTGAMRSKAVYRFAGTLVGAIVTLALVPNLVDTPDLLIGTFALWIGICIYFAVLDRTARSYFFLLAGYTVALIGFPSVDAPDAIWYVVLARVEEITLGIVCTTVIGSVVFPSPLGPGLTARLDAWLRNAATWIVGVLTEEQDAAALWAAERRVAGDAIEIGMLMTHLSFDTSNLQTGTVPVGLLRQRVMLLMPVLSGTADRIGVLRSNGAISAPLKQLLDHIAQWTRTARTSDLAEAERVRTEIAALEPMIDAKASWDDIILSGLLARLRELTDLLHDIIALRRQIRQGQSRLPALAVPPAVTARMRQHRDHVMALHSALAVAFVVGLVSAFWIASAWPEGAQAASLAAVGAAFFAAQDDPAPAITGFTYGVVIALMIDAAYLFVILPQVDGFGMLMLALAPTYLLLGLLADIPATSTKASPIAFLSATLLALSSSYSGDFASFVNGGIAAVVGLGFTSMVMQIIRSVSAEWMTARLLRRNRVDIGHAALNHDPQTREAFAGLLVDRLGLVVSRLAASAPGTDKVAAAALADLRVGMSVIDLQNEMNRLTKAERDAVRAALAALATHFLHREPAGPKLRGVIDHAIATVTCRPGSATPDLLRYLSGIRRGLFPDSAPYTPWLADSVEERQPT
ncbi:MAG TPA: FUSC family protein [Acetobacteraceae bacterium]|nr:FUSC family protein [Acetobacteraceae bacterium]